MWQEHFLTEVDNPYPILEGQEVNPILDHVPEIVSGRISILYPIIFNPKINQTTFMNPSNRCLRPSWNFVKPMMFHCLPRTKTLVKGIFVQKINTRSHVSYGWRAVLCLERTRELSIKPFRSQLRLLLLGTIFVKSQHKRF